MTFASPRRFFYFDGAFDLSWIAWTWNNMAPDLRVRLGLDGHRWGIPLPSFLGGANARRDEARVRDVVRLVDREHDHLDRVAPPRGGQRNVGSANVKASSDQGAARV